MESKGTNPWIAPAIIVPILALLISIFWRLGIWRRVVNWNPWPVSMNIGDTASYRQLVGYEHTYSYWVSVRIEIRPWVTMNIRDFYLELHTDLGMVKVRPVWSTDDLGKTYRLESGYTLRPHMPIGPRIESFQHQTESSEPREIDSHARLVMEIGVRKGKRAIAKRIVLHRESEKSSTP